MPIILYIFVWLPRSVTRPRFLSLVAYIQTKPSPQAPSLHVLRDILLYLLFNHFFAIVIISFCQWDLVPSLIPGGVGGFGAATTSGIIQRDWFSSCSLCLILEMYKRKVEGDVDLLNVLLIKVHLQYTSSRIDIK